LNEKKKHKPEGSAEVDDDWDGLVPVAFLFNKFWKKFFRFVLSVPAVLFPLCIGGLCWVLMLGGVVLFTFGMALISSFRNFTKKM
jgi:hypothetical protein